MMGPLAVRATLLAIVVLCGCRFEPNPGGNNSGDGGGSGSDGQPPGDTIDPDAPPIDAFVFPCDPTACASVNGACAPSGKCVIDVDGNTKFTCPAGLYCAVTCDNANDTCAGGVDCGDAIGCDIRCGASNNNDTCQNGLVECPTIGPCNVTCEGDHACRNFGVACGAGRCEVHCIGTDACQDGGIRCNDSTECIAECTGANACQNGGVGCGVTGSCTVQCDGTSACANETCTGAPTTCTFNCCGSGACGATSPPCGGTCTETNNGC
ncbi:MAG TPA: hypothetical protein VFQ53_12090 [Kofleriaceae bacterium]|nr:hypothetical protein [Kofleriaceae bacterium]